MKPHDVRRANLQRLIDERFEGKAGRFADALGKKRPLVYRLFSSSEESRREIGEGFAREIELKLGLPHGWLDQDLLGSDAPVPPVSVAVGDTAAVPVIAQTFLKKFLEQAETLDEGAFDLLEKMLDREAARVNVEPKRSKDRKRSNS